MLCALGVVVVVIFGLQAALFLDPEIPLAPASWAVLSVCVWLLFVLSKGGWSQLGTNDTRRFTFGIFAAVLFLHYLQLDPDFKGWSSVYYFCGPRLQYCTCDFRWNLYGWLKAVVLWQFVLSTTLGAQQLIIQAGLGGLLPGEEAVTRESFISICWRLIPYWLNNWEQQWGAEVSSMTFELPHFTVELLIILPCCQIICSRLKVLVTPQVNVLLGPAAAGGQGGAEDGAFVREEFAPNVLQGFWERRPEQRRFLPRVRANVRVLAFLVGLTALAALNATLVPLYLEGQAARATETSALVLAGRHANLTAEAPGPGPVPTPALALEQLWEGPVAERLRLYLEVGGGGRGCPSVAPFVTNAKKHATELLRMQDPEHRSLIPLVESALAIMRLSCEKYFVLVAIYLAFLLFRDAPRSARAVIRLVARVSGIFQKVILFAFPAVCWLYNAGVVFSIFVSVVFWGGPLLALYDTARAMLREVTIKGLTPATAEQVERMGGSCAICWGDMAPQPGAHNSNSGSDTGRQHHPHPHCQHQHPQHEEQQQQQQQQQQQPDGEAGGSGAGPAPAPGTAAAGTAASEAAEAAAAAPGSSRSLAEPVCVAAAVAAAAPDEAGGAAAGPATSSAPSPHGRVGSAPGSSPGAQGGTAGHICSAAASASAVGAAPLPSGAGAGVEGAPAAADTESIVAEAGSSHPADTSSSCGRDPRRPSSLTGSYASICCSSASSRSVGVEAEDAACGAGQAGTSDGTGGGVHGGGGDGEQRGLQAGAAGCPAPASASARDASGTSTPLRRSGSLGGLANDHGEAAEDGGGEERGAAGGAGEGAGQPPPLARAASAALAGGPDAEAKAAGWALPCGHAYHHACLSQWMEQCSNSGATPTCPMCQRGIQLQVRWRLPPPFGRGGAGAGTAGADLVAGGTARLFAGGAGAGGAAAAAAAAAGAGGAGGRFAAPGAAAAAAAAADLAAGEDLLNAVRHFAGHDAGLQVVGLLEHQRELQELLHEPPALEFGELLREAPPPPAAHQQHQQQQQLGQGAHQLDPAGQQQLPPAQLPQQEGDWQVMWPQQQGPFWPPVGPFGQGALGGMVPPGHPQGLIGQGFGQLGHHGNIFEMAPPQQAGWPWPGMELDPMDEQAMAAVAGGGAAGGAADVHGGGLPLMADAARRIRGAGVGEDWSDTGTPLGRADHGSLWATPVQSLAALDGQEGPFTHAVGPAATVAGPGALFQATDAGGIEAVAAASGAGACSASSDACRSAPACPTNGRLGDEAVTPGFLGAGCTASAPAAVGCSQAVGAARDDGAVIAADAIGNTSVRGSCPAADGSGFGSPLGAEGTGAAPGAGGCTDGRSSPAGGVDTGAAAAAAAAGTAPPPSTAGAAGAGSSGGDERAKGGQRRRRGGPQQQQQQDTQGQPAVPDDAERPNNRRRGRFLFWRRKQQ